MRFSKSNISLTASPLVGCWLAMVTTFLAITLASGQESKQASKENEDKTAPTKEQQETGELAKKSKDSKPLGPLSETDKENQILAKQLEDSPFFNEEEEEDPELYVLRKGDRISVTVYGEDDLRIEQIIDGSGTVNLKLLEFTRVAGRTVKDAKAHIKERYEKDFLNNAAVSIAVVEKAKRRFVVLGQVRSPGYYEVPRSLKVDIFQAIALAGGYTRIAGRVTIKRTTSQGEEILKFKLRSLRKRGTEIPLVAEDDTIIVGESLF